MAPEPPRGRLFRVFIDNFVHHQLGPRVESGSVAPDDAEEREGGSGRDNRGASGRFGALKWGKVAQLGIRGTVSIKRFLALRVFVFAHFFFPALSLLFSVVRELESAWWMRNVVKGPQTSCLVNLKRTAST